MELSKDYLMEQLGAFNDVENMRTNGGGDAPNQFKLYFQHGVLFKSYDSIIAIRYDSTIKDENLKNKTVIGCDYDYSRTTGRYRNQFLNEGVAETRAKIKDGTYIYCEDLK